MIIKRYRHYRVSLLIGLCSLNGLFGCVTTKHELAIETHRSELNRMYAKLRKNLKARQITTITGLIVASIIVVATVARGMHCIPDFISRANRINSNISHRNKLTIGRAFMQAKGQITVSRYIPSTEEESIIDAIQQNPGNLIVDHTPGYSIKLADPMVLDDRVLQDLKASRFSRKTIRHLFSRGLNINAIDPTLGYTLLMYVACYGHRDTLQFMIDKGANLNAKNKNGYTALHLAIDLGRIKVARRLVQTDHIDLNVVDKSNTTPLHLAARKGYLSIVKAIVYSKNNIDVNQKDKDGNTPFQIAKKFGHQNIAKLLCSSN